MGFRCEVAACRQVKSGKQSQHLTVCHDHLIDCAHCILEAVIAWSVQTLITVLYACSVRPCKFAYIGYRVRLPLSFLHCITMNERERERERQREREREREREICQ